MSRPTSVSGRELWAMLPAVYRDRDAGGDLAGYLDAFGELLDSLRVTLDQRLADSFPESPPGEAQAQEWLLPYFADLLDVRLLSPFVAGRRREVSSAIAWRQAKGALGTIERLAEAVGQLEVEVQEGWRRVAVTPRVDLTLLPAAAFGAAEEGPPGNPLVAARHPGLPVTTVDLRLPSRAIREHAGHPLARTSTFAGEAVTWRQLHPKGAPCFPGSYEDVSPRTVDLRTPGWNQGHFHPRQILLFVPPPAGFFPTKRVTLAWSKRKAAEHQRYVADSVEAPGGRRRIRNPSAQESPPVAVMVTTRPPALDETAIEIDDLSFLGTLTVTSGRLTLRRVAARKVVVLAADGEEPVLDAADCLFDEVVAADGLVRLDACTVMRSLSCRRLQASDCLFAGAVTVTPRRGDAPGCVRYSRLPGRLARDLHRNTTDKPAFFSFAVCDSALAGPRPLVFGEPGYGSLHPATPASISAGAEDGGEMGCGHHRRFSLARAALVAKLEDLLPVGMEAVLIPDPRLLAVPPPLRRVRKPR